MMGMRWGRDVFISSANWLMFQRKGSQRHRSVMQPDLAQLHPSGRRSISPAATRIHSVSLRPPHAFVCCIHFPAFICKGQQVRGEYLRVPVYVFDETRCLTVHRVRCVGPDDELVCGVMGSGCCWASEASTMAVERQNTPSYCAEEQAACVWRYMQTSLYISLPAPLLP
ncbi:hypothetical protein MHYP_G00025440 [Metynnis hypsauchen]